MRKYPWLRLVLFLSLFFLIIWGGLNLMFLLSGQKTASSTPTVWVVFPPSGGGCSLSLVASWGAVEGSFLTEVKRGDLLLDVINRDGAVAVIDLINLRYGADEFGRPIVSRLIESAKRGSRVLFLGNPFRDAPPDSLDQEPLPAGFYQVLLEPSGDSLVLWSEELVDRPALDSSVTILATARTSRGLIPVIWCTQTGRGCVYVSRVHPLLTPGADAFMRQLLSFSDSLAWSSPSTTKPHQIDQHSIDLWLAGISADDTPLQLESIRMLVESGHPAARMVLPPLLWSSDRRVVLAAAEGLLAHRAAEAVAELESAAKFQPEELKPLLMKVASDIKELVKSSKNN